MYINVSQRFIQVVEHLKDSKQLKNQAELVTILEVSKGYVSQLVNGTREPSEAVVSKLVNYFPEINAHWLFTGEGEMLNTQPKNSQVIGNNSGTAINGDGTVVHPAGDSRTIERMQNQIDELLAQNGKLLVIIDRLTQNK